MSVECKLLEVQVDHKKMDFHKVDYLLRRKSQSSKIGDSFFQIVGLTARETAFQTESHCQNSFLPLPTIDPGSPWPPPSIAWSTSFTVFQLSKKCLDYSPPFKNYEHLYSTTSSSWKVSGRFFLAQLKVYHHPKFSLQSLFEHAEKGFHGKSRRPLKEEPTLELLMK